MATDFEIGFEISEDQSFPKSNTQKVLAETYDPNFKYSCSIESLDLGTTYYVRAYMINQMCLYLGEAKTISTTALEITTYDIDTTTYSVTTHVNVQQLSTKTYTYGVCYGTTENPTVNDKTVIASDIDDENNYIVTMTDVPFGTTIYYRSYVMIDGVAHYGEVKSFVREYKVPAYEYVDLGLSVKWATFNVGATKPEEYGNYFAWGETEPKSDYSWSTYKYCNGSYNTLTKYCSEHSFGYNGFTDNKTVLDLEDDAAHVNWGGDWRMPTEEEQDELSENCTWIWTTLNGVNGFKVQSKKLGYTDKWIFLPAAGTCFGDYLDEVGSWGDYYSSSVLDPSVAYYLYFNSAGVHWGSYSSHCNGRSVRPVCP
ncbi:MAG: hypothetical protein MJY79_05630 [Bacteroidaceae bacterium]|nr:hypothetical protein [Bacteroidaceae bacterium]